MVMSKAGSEVILKCLMGKEHEIDIEALPWGPEDERMPAGIETVVPAQTIRPAPGRVLEEIFIKREAGVSRHIVLDRFGDEEESSGHWPRTVEIKDEPID